jgi:kynureninase
MNALQKKPDHLSLEVAEQLDKDDPLGYTSDMFEIDQLVPFAGHSLGPIFKPVVEEIANTTELQKQLHAGHFSDSHPKGKQSGNWFDCDREEESLKGAQQLLGFKEMHEFCFTSSGLSQNLGMLMDTFFSPTKLDWQHGKSKIVILETEFFSDQAIAASVMKRAIKRAEKHDCFQEMKKPIPEDEIRKIKADQDGLYHTIDIINVIKKNADQIQMICLPDIVFNTGQRLELDKIFVELNDVIKKNNMKVILDLAHCSASI